jgi:urease
LSFDRGRAYGKRLDILAGTAVRFEPGDVKTVTLCAIGGAKIISGGNSLATGPLDHASLDAILSSLLKRGFLSVPEPGAQEVHEDTSVSRETYIAAFGPTVGDRVRLGDTELWIEVERDEVSPNILAAGCHLILHRRYMATKSSLVEASPTNEASKCILFDLSAGKSIREGMGQATNRPALEALDLVITNALIVDWSGIYKVKAMSSEPRPRVEPRLRRISA